MPPNPPNNWDKKRTKIIGLGEQSIRKSYYPELQERLEELERFKALLNETNDAILLSKIPSGFFTDFNTAACQQLRYAPEEMFKVSIEDIFAPEKLEETKKIFSQLMDEESTTNRKTIETKLKRSDDTQFHAEISISFVRFGDYFYFVMVARDITDRKAFENALKSSLKEKDVLIQEIHHRVKNNMQIISSLLSLQSDHVKDIRDKGLFEESKNRVRSMAIIHQKVYKSEDLTSIDFSTYIPEIVYGISNSYQIGPNLEIEVNVDPISLNIDTAIPCGLIINELLTNSIKHAFPNGIPGKISIEFHEYKPGEITLIVRDNGVGIPENIDFRNTKSLGLQLVITLTKQLHASISLDKQDGTEFKIVFCKSLSKQ